MVNIQEKKIKLNWAWIEKKIQRSLTKLFESQKLEPEITKVFWFLEHESDSTCIKEGTLFPNYNSDN
jgi:hypothetical protein